MYYKSILLTIKEENNNRLTITNETIKDNGFFIEAYLKPKEINICPNCSSTNVISNGKKQRCFQDEYYANEPTFVSLTYHRFLCKDCSKMFVDKIAGLNPKQSISTNIKLNILEDLKDDISFTAVASKRHVSIQTVIDVFESFVSIDRIPFGYVLCMDEFKNLKSSSGKYAFVMYDPNSHMINDVLPDRIQKTIDDYLYSIDWHEKNQVRYVVTDMNESYRSIIKRHFINATHIIDTFHFLRYVEDAFNKLRIRIQSKFKVDSPEYRILKRYWRILSTYYIDVEGDNLYNPLTKKYCDVNTILDYAISLDSDLTSAYKLTQDFLYGIRTVKYEDSSDWLDNWISKASDANIKEFIDLKSMFYNWKQEIINSFIRFGERKLHNGYIEGINNQIKVIKRIAFGYQNFTHFRNRIMYIINNGVTAYKRVDVSKIYRKPRKKK